MQDAENNSILLYENLDYYIQLLIIIKIKRFLQNLNAYDNENKDILNKKIEEYIYYTVFYTTLNRNNIKQKIYKIYNDNIFEDLDLRWKFSFKNLIVILIKYCKYNSVYNCLYIRNKLRDIAKYIIKKR